MIAEIRLVNYFRFTPESRHLLDSRKESANNPKRTFATLEILRGKQEAGHSDNLNFAVMSF
jgi:hypothetical protein